MKFLSFLAVFAIITPALGHSRDILPIPDKFVNAIGSVETGNKDNLVGDRGAALSRYQIHKACYLDAAQYNKSINFSYSSLTNAVHAKLVLVSYLNRYEKQAIINQDWQSLAKCWNGGANWRNKTGRAKTNLNNYWLKVKKIIN